MSFSEDPLAEVKGEAENIEAVREADICESDEDDVGDEEVQLIVSEPLPAVIPDNLCPALRERLLRSDRADDAQIAQMATPDQLHFDWRSDSEVFTGAREIFTGVSGPTFPLSEMTHPLSAFLKYWDDRILNYIVMETNKYAERELNRLKQAEQIKMHSRLHSWKPTDKNEVLVFFAVIMYHGLEPLIVEKDYFKSSGTFAMPGIAVLMTYNRFLLLKRFLYFNDSDRMPDNLTLDQQRLYKIEPVVSHLRERFMALYNPKQGIAIDESLLHWSGRLSFAQKIGNNLAKVGIKSCELVESSTGYLWNFFIYSGAKKKADGPLDEQSGGQTQSRTDGQTDEQAVRTIEPDGATAKMVFDLVSPLLGKGHTLVMDNFYNSPLLARCLKTQRTDVLGTLRILREFVPDDIRSLEKSDMKVGEVAYTHTHDLTVLLWRDGNLFSMMSTYHEVEIGAKEKDDNKPEAVLDYIRLMGGVDKKDQILSAVPMERASKQVWYQKLFRRLLNISILNASVLFSYTGSNLTQRGFRVRLAEEIIAAFRTEPIPVKEVRILAEAQSRPQLLPNHFIMKGPTRFSSCKLCRSRTVYKCEQCKISLCLEICFKKYHSRQ